MPKMKKLVLWLTFLSLNSFALEINKEAPAFNLMGADGKDHSLSEYKGKVVVLEWLNHGCPFVRKHYDTNNMQKTQEFALAKGVKWISIISSAPGKQGYSDAGKALTDKIANDSKAHNILLDPKGIVGKAYKAKTTPYMVIVNEKGLTSYMGALDSIASADKEDVPRAKNYVKMALSDLFSGKKVKLAKTDSYGCGVKY
jgi:hypothetical protein